MSRRNYFSLCGLSSIVSDIEEFGEEFGDECYDEGYEDGVQHGWEENWEDFTNKESGIIKRTHNYNGEIVHVWIEGPDFNGDRYAW